METTDIYSTKTSVKENIQNAFSAAVRFKAAGKDDSETRLMLMGLGFSYEESDEILSRAKKTATNNKKESKGDELGIGFLWFVGGLIVTVLTYSAASNGGCFLIAWGPMIYGVIKMLKGIFS